MYRNLLRSFSCQKEVEFSASFELSRGGPVGSIYVCSESGWMNEDLFVIWLKTFVSDVQSPIQNATLNHSSHVSIRSYYFYQDNGTIVVSVSPHTPCRMQPLAVSSAVYLNHLKTENVNCSYARNSFFTEHSVQINCCRYRSCVSIC